MNTSETIHIVGAGIAGLSLGWQLACRGRHVTVLENGTIASGASGVATAYLEPRLGTGLLRRLEWESVRRWPAFAKDIEETSGESIDFRTAGQLRIAWPEDEADIRTDFQQRAEQGWDVEWVDGGALRELEPSLSDEIPGAALVRDVNWVHGSLLCRALARAIEATGGTVLENTAVRGLSTVNGKLRRLLLENEDIPSSTAILCSALGTNDLADLPSDVPRSRGTKGMTLFYASPVPKLTRMIRRRDISIVPRRDGLLAGSSRERGTDDLTPDPQIVAQFHGRACRVLPELQEHPPPEPRCGFRPMVGDGLLRLGRSSVADGLYYSLSHAGVGFMRAAVISDEFAEFVLNNDSPCPAIDPFLNRK